MDEKENILLETMVREYWAIDNNEECTKASIIALRKFGFSDKRIQDIMHVNIKNYDLEETNSELNETIEDIDFYYY